MVRTRRGIEHLSGRDYDLTAADALYLIVFSLAPQLGLSPEDIAVAAAPVSQERATG